MANIFYVFEESLDLKAKPELENLFSVDRFLITKFT